MPLPKSSRIVSRNRSFGENDPNEYWRTDGIPIWEVLDEKILAENEKVVVSTDPGLSPQTMSLLRKEVAARREIDLDQYDFKFGDPDDPSVSDIGLALLSSCIRDNMKATRAELVARVAAICGTPFFETAVAILKQELSPDGLFVYDIKTGAMVPWTPRTPGQAISQSSFERRTDLAEEWALLGKDFY